MFLGSRCSLLHPMRRYRSCLNASYSVLAIFPGQGTQVTGMGQSLYACSPVARARLDEANKAVGMDLLNVMFKGDARPTEICQPAVFANAIASYEAFMDAAKREKVKVDVRTMMGHSLGEVSAIVAAGVLPYDQALQLVRIRGRCMGEARALPSTTDSGMLALLFRRPEDGILAVTELEEVLMPALRAEGFIVTLAGHNSHEQLVLAGHNEAMRRCAAHYQTKGWLRRALTLETDAPFHSPLMAFASSSFLAAVQDLEIDVAQPEQPVVFSAFDLAPIVFPTADILKLYLAKTILKPVRWQPALDLAHRPGDRIIEFGSETLSKILRRAWPEAKISSVTDAPSLEKTLEWLGE